MSLFFCYTILILLPHWQGWTMVLIEEDALNQNVRVVEFTTFLLANVCLKPKLLCFKKIEIIIKHTIIFWVRNHSFIPFSVYLYISFISRYFLSLPKNLIFGFVNIMMFIFWTLNRKEVIEFCIVVKSKFVWYVDAKRAIYF